jgi:hypothetical protein
MSLHPWDSRKRVQRTEEGCQALSADTPLSRCFPTYRRWATRRRCPGHHQSLPGPQSRRWHRRAGAAAIARGGRCGWGSSRRTPRPHKRGNGGDAASAQRVRGTGHTSPYHCSTVSRPQMWICARSSPAGAGGARPELPALPWAQGSALGSARSQDSKPAQHQLNCQCRSTRRCTHTGHPQL